MISANYSIKMALIQDIGLTTKKYVCRVKDFKNNFKNQSINLDLYGCCDETKGGKKSVVLPPQDKL